MADIVSPEKRSQNKARGYNLDFKNPSTQLEQSIPSPEEVIRKTSDCLTRSRQILLEIEELLK